jgi:hypothetical protein
LRSIKHTRTDQRRIVMNLGIQLTRGRSNLRFRRMVRLVIAAASAGTLLLGASDAAAGTRTWIGGNDVWSTPGNWSPNGSPVPGDDVLIAQGAFTRTYDAAAGSASLGSVTLDNGMTLAQSVASASVTTVGDLNIGATGAGTWRLEAGSLTVGAGINLGAGTGGAGTLNVTNAATVTCGGLSVGAQTGASGTIELSGAALVVQNRLSIGGSSAADNSGAGSLTITGGSSATAGDVVVGDGVSGANHSRGTLLVTGPGSSLTTSGIVRAGPASGTQTSCDLASMHIGDGATVRANATLWGSFANDGQLFGRGYRRTAPMHRQHAEHPKRVRVDPG